MVVGKEEELSTRKQFNWVTKLKSLKVGELTRALQLDSKVAQQIFLDANNGSILLPKVFPKLQILQPSIFLGLLLGNVFIKLIRLQLR